MRKYYGELRSGAPGSYDVDDVSRGTAMEDDQVKYPSRTIQSAKDETDINLIVRRFGLTGQLPSGSPRLPTYGDFAEVDDFQSAMNAVRVAEESFLELPSTIRSRFGNNPQAFLEFVANPENVPEIVKMGLAKRVDPVILPVRDEVSRETGDRNERSRQGSVSSGSTSRADKRAKASAGSGGNVEGESGDS